jgi:hypothetical protein
MLIANIIKIRDRFLNNYTGDNIQTVIDDLTINVTSIESMYNSVIDTLEPKNNYKTYYNNRQISALPIRVSPLFVNVDVTDPRFTIKTCYPVYKQQFNQAWDKSQYYPVTKSYIENITIRI